MNIHLTSNKRSDKLNPLTLFNLNREDTNQLFASGASNIAAVLFSDLSKLLITGNVDKDEYVTIKVSEGVASITAIWCLKTNSLDIFIVGPHVALFTGDISFYFDRLVMLREHLFIKAIPHPALQLNTAQEVSEHQRSQQTKMDIRWWLPKYYTNYRRWLMVKDDTVKRIDKINNALRLEVTNYQKILPSIHNANTHLADARILELHCPYFESGDESASNMDWWYTKLKDTHVNKVTFKYDSRYSEHRFNISLANAVNHYLQTTPTASMYEVLSRPWTDEEKRYIIDNWDITNKLTHDEWYTKGLISKIL